MIRTVRKQPREKPSNVLWCSTVNDIKILGKNRSFLENWRHPTDNDEFNASFVQSANDGVRLLVNAHREASSNHSSFAR